MPIQQTDIVLRQSGGASNSDHAASLGGVKSSVEVVPAQLFDTVSSAESTAGSTEFRCIYVENMHATLTMSSTKLWLSANTPSADTAITVGLGSSALNGTEQTVANASTAPADVTFSAAANSAAAIELGSIPAGQKRAVWLRRTVVAGTAAIASDTFSVSIECETAA